MKIKYQLFNERRHCIFFLSLLGKQVKETGGKFQLRDMFRGVYYYKGLTLGLWPIQKPIAGMCITKVNLATFRSMRKLSSTLLKSLRKEQTKLYFQKTLNISTSNVINLLYL